MVNERLGLMHKLFGYEISKPDSLCSIEHVSVTIGVVITNCTDFHSLANLIMTLREICHHQAHSDSRISTPSTTVEGIS